MLKSKDIFDIVNLDELIPEKDATDAAKKKRKKNDG